MKTGITLAVETGVGGGSLAVFERQTLLDSLISEQNASRSEILLTDINALLQKNGIKKKDINLLAVSVGPGSFTGLRIGLGVIYGLRDGLGIECRGVSVLEAMNFGVRQKEKTVTAFLYSKDEICWQSFERGKASAKPQIVLFREFVEQISADSSESIVIDQRLNRVLNQSLACDNDPDGLPLSFSKFNVVENLATAVGISCIQNYGSDKVNTLYLSKIPTNT